MSRQRIAAYEKRLARPVPPNPYSAYSRFVAAAPDETFGSVFQDEIIQFVATRDGRITDIRELPPTGASDGVRMIRHQVAFEGDLQTLADVLGELGETGRPLLVNTLSIRPIGSSLAPDRNLRISMETAQWMEAQP